MKNYTVIYNIFSNPSDWNSILEVALDLADKFSIVYSDEEYDEENPLETGKLDFFQLPNLTLEPWQDMAGVNLYTGTLDASSKELIIKYMHAEAERYGYSLWNFSLYEGDVELLNVADFHDCLINMDSNLVRILKEKNIDFSY